jgi:hypothetical protein
VVEAFNREHVLSRARVPKFLEGVDRECRTVSPAGNLEAFGAVTRAASARIRSGAKPVMARWARAEAQRLFSVDRVADGVVTSLDAALAVPDGG